MSQIEEYQSRYEEHLQQIAGELEDLVCSHLSGIERIDRISARAKTPASFEGKATSVNGEGKLKYERPLEQIQDQLGVRVIVFYKSDVEHVSRILTDYFNAIESKDRFVESEWEFGYAGKHLVLFCPKDAIPEGVDGDRIPDFFEVQIKTLYEHAWSEANHDLGYKANTPLSSEQKRVLAFTSAQSWGADKMFSDLVEQQASEA